LKSINAKKRLLKEIKPRGPAANSDHYYFTEAGVPAFFIYTMGPNKHYHDVEDRYEALSFEAFDSLNQLLLTFIRKIK
jgi:Zn-dependent M28 family amino/carboxypeptidase